MTDQSQLKDLERRLAEAKEPDRETDRQLAEVDGWRAHEDGEPDYAPLYTSSLDAAVSLVERVLPETAETLTVALRGYDNGVYQGGKAGAFLMSSNFMSFHDVRAFAASAPLAVCLACVRALIAQGEK